MPQKMFLKLDGVHGESKSPRHFGEIEISGFSWGDNQQASATNGGPGKAQINGLVFSKSPDKTSPLLWVACHTGQGFKEGILTLENISASGSLLRSVSFKFKPVLLDAVTTDENGETIKLNFESMKIMQS